MPPTDISAANPYRAPGCKAPTKGGQGRLAPTLGDRACVHYKMFNYACSEAAGFCKTSGGRGSKRALEEPVEDEPVIVQPTERLRARPAILSEIKQIKQVRHLMSHSLPASPAHLGTSFSPVAHCTVMCRHTTVDSSHATVSEAKLKVLENKLLYSKSSHLEYELATAITPTCIISKRVPRSVGRLVGLLNSLPRANRGSRHGENGLVEGHVQRTHAECVTWRRDAEGAAEGAGGAERTGLKSI